MHVLSRLVKRERQSTKWRVVIESGGWGLWPLFYRCQLTIWVYSRDIGPPLRYHEEARQALLRLLHRTGG